MSTDKLTPDARSALMAKVRSKNTAPEIRVRKAAHAMGIRFRLGRRDLPGSPDLVFPRHRLAVFVHGCFWHRHPDCRRASMPATRSDFWEVKFDKNVLRDRAAVSALHDQGWKTLVIWECETKSQTQIQCALREAIDRES